MDESHAGHDGSEDVLTAPGESWAPADCTLPSAERPLRAAEFSDLFAGAVLSAERPEPGLLRLHLQRDRHVAGRVAELAAAETECCSFFTFTLMVGGDSLLLDIAVPAGRAGILDALAAQAAPREP